jgi:hypothetical protein
MAASSCRVCVTRAVPDRRISLPLRRACLHKQANTPRQRRSRAARLGRRVEVLRVARSAARVRGAPRRRGVGDLRIPQPRALRLTLAACTTLGN